MSREDRKLSGAMRIFEALSGVDEELLEKCEELSEARRTNIRFVGRRMRTAAGIAAVLCAAVAGISMWSLDGDLIPKKSAESAPYRELADLVQDVGSAEEAEAPEAPKAEAMIEETTREEDVFESQANSAIKNGVSDNADEYKLGNEAQPEAVGAPKDDRRDITEAEAREMDVFGKYVPAVLPSGYLWEEGKLSVNEETSEVEAVTLCWASGMDNIRMVISKTDPGEIRITEVSRKETYDVHRYQIPYGESVPEEYREMFQMPVFRAEELTMEVVKARMKTVADAGDTDTPRGNFGVLYEDGVLVQFDGDSVPEAVWEIFVSLE